MDIRGLLTDPQFMGLSGSDKRAVLARTGLPTGFIDEYLALPEVNDTAGVVSDEPGGGWNQKRASAHGALDLPEYDYSLAEPGSIGGEAALGMGKTLSSDVIGAIKAVKGMFGGDTSNLQAMRDSLAPSNEVQKTAETTTRIGEFLAPLPGSNLKAIKALKDLGLLGKMGAGALQGAAGAGMIGSAQAGEPNLPAAAGGAIGGAASPVIEQAGGWAARELLGPLFKKLKGRIPNGRLQKALDDMAANAEIPVGTTRSIKEGMTAETDAARAARDEYMGRVGGETVDAVPAMQQVNAKRAELMHGDMNSPPASVDPTLSQQLGVRSQELDDLAKAFGDNPYGEIPRGTLEAKRAALARPVFDAADPTKQAANATVEGALRDLLNATDAEREPIMRRLSDAIDMERGFKGAKSGSMVVLGGMGHGIGVANPLGGTLPRTLSAQSLAVLSKFLRENPELLAQGAGALGSAAGGTNE